MRQTERRLRELETDRRALGVRVFMRDEQDVTLWREHGRGIVWSGEELDVLAADGWTVLRVVYEDA